MVVKDISSFMKAYGNPLIGIIKNDKELLNKFAHADEWAVRGHGYGIIGNSGERRSKAFNLSRALSEPKYLDRPHRFCHKEDSISIHLDLKNCTLSYTANDKDYGIAFHDIEPNDYRLAISISDNNQDFILELL